MRDAAYLFLAAMLIPCAGVSSDKDGSTYSFVETNLEGQEVRTLALALTDENGKACIGGNWKRARVVADPGKYTKDPVYTLENGKLEVLLINGYCDAYDSYIGEIATGTFAGDHVRYGWGSKIIGNVKGNLSKAMRGRIGSSSIEKGRAD